MPEPAAPVPEVDVRQLRARLERGEATPVEVLPFAARAAIEAPTRTARAAACQLLGDLAGRALGADWEVAERAAFALLEVARLADTGADRRAVLEAMGAAFRNLWLLPFVHRRLHDKDPSIAEVALQAAGGLAFPALEDAIAEFVHDGAPPALRRAAIAALGRMGAMSAVDRLVPLIAGDPLEAIAALGALTEIRSPAGRDAALAVIGHELEPEVQIAAARYLAELGALEVLPTLRRLARHQDAEIRISASEAARAFKAERQRDAGERFLTALAEPDRAVRALLARRLRTLEVSEVLEQAEILLSDDASGVVQILGELREDAVTRYLLGLVERPALPTLVKARAIGAVEADEVWERGELAKLAHRDDLDPSVRAAAVQAMGAFASSSELLDRVGDLATSPAAAIRGAVLWALQLAARADDGSDALRLAEVVAPLLADPDPAVRRRATYVVGNLGLDKLAPALAKRLGADEPPDLRLAAYVALGELGIPNVLADVVAAVRREEDPRVLGAASNALVAAAPPAAQVANLAPRAAQLLTAPDPRAREAGAEIAGLVGGAVPASKLLPLAADPVAAVRGAALWALGKLGDPATEPALLAAFRDDDATIHDRAASGLLVLGTPAALAQAIAYAAGDGDETARAELAGAIAISRPHAEELGPHVDRALGNLTADDLAFEPLLRLKLSTAARAHDAPATPIDVDGEIAGLFPAFAQLTKLSGFDPLVRSLRTAESLFQSTGASKDADQSPPITLWMKVLENYVHAWLGPRMTTLQRDPSTLFDYVDRVIGGAWGSYARWLEPKWKDQLDVGSARVEVPLRSVPNCVKELQEHRRKRLDSVLSVTEWSRLMLLFAVDHPSGFKNLLKVGTKSNDKTVALAHRMHVLAAVRNLVTHRANAGAATLAAFRRGYYAAFEDLVALA